MILSHKILDVIICPKEQNIFSKSCWVILFDNPDTYKLAPLIESELGRANDTYIYLQYNIYKLFILFFFYSQKVK